MKQNKIGLNLSNLTKIWEKKRESSDKERKMRKDRKKE